MRLRGPLDVEALRVAVQHVVDAHEALRTTFHERDGRPVQVIGAPPRIDIPIVELDGSQDSASATEEALRRLAVEPFDLERGPLLRMWVARVSDDDHRLLRLNHHIVTDWVSWRVLFEDLARAYEAHRRGEPLPETGERLQYADFAAWERRRLRADGPLYRDQLEWWRRAVEPEWPSLRLPFSRPAEVTDVRETDGVIRWSAEPGEMEALDELARRGDTTLFVVALAALVAQLGLETGQEEIALGTYAMNRPLPEARSMFGFFSNPITLMMRFDAKLSFRRRLARVREVLVETRAHGEIPYDELSMELHRSGTPPPEISAMLLIRSRWPPLESAGVEFDAPRYVSLGMPWGFSLLIDPYRESERWKATFDARIHDPDAVRGFIDRYRRLVGAVLRKPRRRLTRLRP
jgi:hypothetical protein